MEESRKRFELSQEALDEIERVSEANYERYAGEVVDRKALSIAQNHSNGAIGMRFRVEGRMYEIMLVDTDNPLREVGE